MADGYLLDKKVLGQLYLRHTKGGKFSPSDYLAAAAGEVFTRLHIADQDEARLHQARLAFCLEEGTLALSDRYPAVVSEARRWEPDQSGDYRTLMYWQQREEGYRQVFAGAGTNRLRSDVDTVDLFLHDFCAHPEWFSGPDNEEMCFICTDIRRADEIFADGRLPLSRAVFLISSMAAVGGYLDELLNLKQEQQRVVCKELGQAAGYATAVRRVGRQTLWS